MLPALKNLFDVHPAYLLLRQPAHGGLLSLGRRGRKKGSVTSGVTASKKDLDGQPYADILRRDVADSAHDARPLLQLDDGDDVGDVVGRSRGGRPRWEMV